MPPTFDLRTYAKLEAAMIRHLVKDWRQRSAPIFTDIAAACRNRQWNEARRRVPELDLHDVGLENKEWIKYFLHSFAVFGGGCVAKQRPSFVGVGSFETTLNQVAQNVVTYLELTATSQVQVQTLQLIAEDEAMATAPLKVAKDVRWDESQHPRNPAGSDAGGEFASTAGMRPYAKKDAERLKALGVPPDWTDVEVAISPKAELLVVGKDAKGRKQYWYSAEHDEKAAAEKFARVKEFAGVADKVSAQTLQDLASEDAEVREAAAALYVIEKTAFRIGSNAETKADKKAYGVTTLLGKHVRVLDGGRVSFRFPGKSGVLNAKIIKDPVLHKMMSERKGGSDAPLFDTSDSKVRDYMARTAPGFHPKDYRTYQGTAIALLEISKRKTKAKTDTEFKRVQKMVAKVVAAHLGNTPTVAIESYINPAVWGRLRA